jgi:O-antigen/teichoic acid export membrane protein
MGYYVTERTIAIYGIICGLVAAMAIAISAGNAIFAPVIIKHYQNYDYHTARKTFRFVQKCVLLLSLPLFFTLCLFSNEILSNFSNSIVEQDLISCLIILAVAQLINAATGPVATSLYMRGDIPFFAISMMACVVLNVAGNIWLVPRYGALGAAFSTATVITLVNVVQYTRARQLNIV